MLSLSGPSTRDTTAPEASTASTPTTDARIDPQRSTRTPPALVDTAPPTVAVSRDAKSTPSSQPAARACACKAAREAPAPATHVPPLSTGDNEVSRRVETTTPPNGTAPPTRPVFPPCGTTGTPAAAHRRTTSATSGREPGRTTATEDPLNRPVQSLSYEARTEGSVSTCAAPTTDVSDPTRSTRTTPPA